MAKAVSIYRSKIHEHIVQALSGERAYIFDESGKKLFPTIRELLTFCALLGYYNNKRVPLDKLAGTEDIQGVTYEDTEALEFIWLIGLAETMNLETLKDGNEKICSQIFEEYANGGLDLLSHHLNDNAKEKWPKILFELSNV